MRVGFGYDVHPLVSGRPLVLGGITIPYLFGLHGHSDADVLIHAICDAILGAISEGDIGRHFPDSDPQYAGIKSTLLLKKVKELMRAKKFIPINIDSTIVAKGPKLSEYVPKMIKEISEILEIDQDRVNIKATTTEGLGFVGRGEGIAAYAVVLVENEKEKLEEGLGW
jgi:2-C-methyl-D-erythritol 2,4-cyclodiphosphate synthase